MITNKKKLTLDEIKKKLAEADANLNRQHGKLGVKCEDEEKELKKIYNNLKSRESRARKRALEKHQDYTYNKLYGLHADEDEYGIRAIDRRRYTKCFKSGYIDARVTRKYVKMMTGLTLNQIYILQNETGLIPYPAVTKKEANEDEKYRWETGMYFN